MREEEKKEEEKFEERILDLKRVSRVTAGGKRFRFRALVVIGNKSGRLGIGLAKGIDVPESISKAKYQAQKNLFNVVLKETTIPYEVEAKYSAAKVRLKPARAGHGLIAGGAVRDVLELAGVKDISAKILGRTKNKLTNALATIKALKKFKA